MFVKLISSGGSGIMRPKPYCTNGGVPTGRCAAGSAPIPPGCYLGSLPAID
jgi:hypothetical protein